MVDYREILRLNADHTTMRQIALSVEISRNTVSEVLHTSEEKHISHLFEDDATDGKLQNI